MRLIQVACVIAGVLLATPASGQLPSPKVKNSFRTLFTPPDVKEAAASMLDEGRVRATAERKSNCSMLVIPADPAIDPGIQVRRDADAPRYTMRVIPPPPCK